MVKSGEVLATFRIESDKTKKRSKALAREKVMRPAATRQPPSSQ